MELCVTCRVGNRVVTSPTRNRNKQNITTETRAKHGNRRSSQEDTQVASRHTETLTVTKNQGDTNQSYKGEPLTPVGTAVLERRRHGAGGVWRPGSRPRVVGTGVGAATAGTPVHIPQNRRTELRRDPTTPLLSFIQKNGNQGVQWASAAHCPMLQTQPRCHPQVNGIRFSRNP